jgi:hypothetical protein
LQWRSTSRTRLPVRVGHAPVAHALSRRPRRLQRTEPSP